MAPSRSRSSTATAVDLGPIAPGRVRKGRGRPLSTAVNVWTRTNLRNLAKLYFCTNLEVEAIGLILAALAARRLPGVSKYVFAAATIDRGLTAELWQCEIEQSSNLQASGEV